LVLELMKRWEYPGDCERTHTFESIDFKILLNNTFCKDKI